MTSRSALQSVPASRWPSANAGTVCVLFICERRNGVMPHYTAANPDRSEPPSTLIRPYNQLAMRRHHTGNPPAQPQSP
jgi:hypothetical protein